MYIISKGRAEKPFDIDSCLWVLKSTQKK